MTMAGGIDYIPLPFRDLEPDQKFRRWDRIRVRWRRAADDSRIESKRIDSAALRVVGQVPKSERHAVASRAIVGSLETEWESGRSLALIRPENVKFMVRSLSDNELSKSRRRRAELLDQGDLLASSIISKEPCPFAFYYEFDHALRRRTHICIDWETENTYFKWRSKYGEAEALRHMKNRWGIELPASGLAFAFGTHRVKMFRKWLLSGVIQIPLDDQASLLL